MRRVRRLNVDRPQPLCPGRSEKTFISGREYDLLSEIVLKVEGRGQVERVESSERVP